MTEAKDPLDVLLDQIKQERDELRVRLHLAKADLRDEWEQLEAKAEELGGVAADASEDIGAAAKLLAEEVLAGFKKIRRHL